MARHYRPGTTRWPDPWRSTNRPDPLLIGGGNLAAALINGPRERAQLAQQRQAQQAQMAQQALMFQALQADRDRRAQQADRAATDRETANADRASYQNRLLALKALQAGQAGQGPGLRMRPWDPDTIQQSVDPTTGKVLTTRRPKTAAEVDAERAAQDRYRNGSPPAAGTPAPPAGLSGPGPERPATGLALPAPGGAPTSTPPQPPAMQATAGTPDGITGPQPMTDDQLHLYLYQNHPGYRKGVDAGTVDVQTALDAYRKQYHVPAPAPASPATGRQGGPVGLGLPVQDAAAPAGLSLGG